MAWEDSDQKFEMNDEAPEGRDAEETPPSSVTPKGFLARIFQQPAKPWGWITAAVLFIIILLVLFFPRSSGNEFRERINVLEQRLTQIEGKLAQDERLNERLAKVEEEAKELNTFMFQLRRSEKSLNDRINRLSKRVAARKPTPKAAPAKTKTAKTTTAAVKPAQYHTVKKGDTLFGIARKYELSVNELQRLNKLKANAVLFPGQRLLVKPAN